MTGEDRRATEAVAVRVRAAWTDALHLDDELDPDQPFLAAGGHSLAAARLIARLSGDLAVEVPMSAVLRDNPSLTEFLETVTERVWAPPATEATDQGHAPVSAAAETAGAQPPAAGSPGSPSAPSPLAPTMRRVWTWHRLHPDCPAYNVVRVLSIAGRVQPAALRAALADLSRRHEALRCAVAEPRPARPEVVVGEPVPVPVSIEVVRAGAGDLMTAVDQALYRIADRPFPMAMPPLWRVGVVYAPALGQTWLVLVMHHLIADLRASDIVLADLAAAYRARATGTTPAFTVPAPSLLSYLAREARQVGTPRWEQDLAWWSRRLAAAGPTAPLPLSAAGRGEHAYAGSCCSADMPADEADALDHMLHSHGLTPAIFFLTAASQVLGAWHGHEQAQVLGLPSVRISHPEDERLIAFLLDTLMLPVTVHREHSFRRAYDVVRDAFTDAVDHALPAYDDILDRLRLPRAHGARSPLIQLWFSDLTQADPPLSFGGDAAAEYDLPPAWALFDVNLYLRRSPAGYRLHLVTPRGLGEQADHAALLRQIVRTAVRAAQHPDRPAGELLEPPAGTGRAAGGVIRPRAVEPTAELLARHARQRPASVAVADHDGELDYQSLDARVDELASALRTTLEPGAVVAVPARRDRHFIARLLACWRAGAVPVLVDADWPQWRRVRALEVAAVTNSFPWAGEGPAAAIAHAAGLAAIPPSHDGGPRHVLFTSGTTSDPLAVLVSTDLADSAVADLVARFGIDADDRVAMLSSPAHDPVLRDLGLALRAGARVCIPPPETSADSSRLACWLRRERVSVLSATPTMLALALGADGQPLPDLRAVLCGGSPLSATTAALIRSRAAGAVVVNGYGCTETPQLVVAYDIAPDQRISRAGQVPVGQPLPGRRVEVLAGGRRCDVGQLGELWVAAPHIAECYLGGGRPDRFVSGKDGVRWLRTGDLARFDAAGRLHLAGRGDRQVLVNGCRVMLEEIESAARDCAGVTDAVAQVLGEAGGQAVRVWVQSAAAAVTEDAVRAHLAAVLPPSVVPARVLVVARLEMSGNMKPVPPQRVPATRKPKPDQPPDRRLRELAESVLGRPFDPAMNFFDAGFTSATLLHLSAELGQVLGRPVAPLSMFNHPNLGALTAFLFGSQAVLTRSPAPPPDDQRPEGLARMRSSRRQVRSWIQRSGGPPDPTV